MKIENTVSAARQLRLYSNQGESKRPSNDYMKTSSILNVGKKQAQKKKETDASDTKSASSSASTEKSSSSNDLSAIQDAKPAAAGKQKGRGGKKQQKKTEVEYNVVIPVQPPPSVEASNKSANYLKYINTLTSVLESTENWNSMDKQHREFLSSMADTLSKNPSYSMDQKKEALKIAIDFLNGKPFQYHVKALEGTQQEKAYYKRLGMPIPAPSSHTSDSPQEKVSE